MIEIVNGIIIITLIIIIYKYVEKSNYDIILQKSSINGKEYLVRNLPDKQKAADTIATIAIKLQQLVDIIQNMGADSIYDKYLKLDIIKETSGGGSGKKDLIEGQNEEGSSEQKNLEHKIKMDLKDNIERLVKNFNADAISENTPNSAHTSYSQNKGEKIVFCIRQKNDKEEIVKLNTLLFVAYHECSHIYTKSISHTPEFWNNFRLILRIAIDNGLYENVDYNNKSEEYCGINISDNPLK